MNCSSGGAAIELTGINKSYRIGKTRVPIFRNLDLSIPAGDFVAVMGPSGSGKSTLLNLLGGIDRADQGNIRIDDVLVSSLGEGALTAWRADNVGIVFQFYNLLPMLSTEQNVQVPLLLKQLSGSSRRARVATVLDLVRLSDRARQRPGVMSGGQQQRIGIARAIVSNPRLLLCDEPTGDLDRQSAVEIMSMLQMLNQELEKTIVLVTHDPEAARFARRVLLLDKGVFVAHEPALT